MAVKHVLTRIALHLLAWILMLLPGVAAILGGIALVGHGYWSNFIVRARIGRALVIVAPAARLQPWSRRG